MDSRFLPFLFLAVAIALLGVAAAAPHAGEGPTGPDHALQPCGLCLLASLPGLAPEAGATLQSLTIHEFAGPADELASAIEPVRQPYASRAPPGHPSERV